jgi:ABC-2 type transport system ATP-binding protein
MSSTANQSTIEVKGLSKSYGHFEAVRGVSFDVHRGEIVGFLGPNGAGKSTIMKILTCYMSATAGTVRVAGHDVYSEALAVRRKVGYQPENVPLYEEMVVYDYLLFMAKMRGVPRAERKARIDYVARKCSLQEVMGKLIRELSKGYRQRVGLAQALIHDPAVVILDEPMSGLDPNQILEIRDLIKEVGRDKTVIFSSHILGDIEKICDRILIIDRGKLVADGTTAELTALLEGRRRYELVLAEPASSGDELRRKLEPVASRVERVPNAASDVVTLRLTGAEATDLRPAIVSRVAAEGWSLLELRELTRGLEDVFRALTASHRGRSVDPVSSPPDRPVALGPPEAVDAVDDAASAAPKSA